jgi:two-component system response regulator AtoC
MVGVSAAMQDLFDTIQKVARHKAAVLITGESGTGKELVARAIHDLSLRKSQAFVAINCGAIPANLLESELFGYRRGAFTDAVRDKAGLFEVADGGTLFLDEVGELPLNLQVKLLRALQEEEIRRIGDNRTTKVDVRIIAATLRNLTDDVANGRFREDLFYRLNVLPIVLPALRERREDIRPLAEHFVAVYRQRHRGGGSQAESISEEAMGMLETYDWPGNIRELENTIERAMVLADGPRIEAHLLDGKLSQRPQVAARAATVERDSAALDDKDLSIKKHTRRIEEELIRRALEKSAGNRHNASKLLGISYRALLYKIKEYGI